MKPKYLCCALVIAHSLSPLFATQPPITDVVFSPTGDSVIGVSQAGLTQFSWPELKKQRSIQLEAGNQHAISFSPNGKMIAVGGGNPAEDGMIQLLSWPDLQQRNTVSFHKDSVKSIAWINSDLIVSSSLDRSIKLHSLSATKSNRVFKGHSRGVNAICLLADAETLVSAGDDQSLRVWDLNDGTLIRSLSQHTRPVHKLALRPGKEGLPMVASASSDRTIRFWQPTIGRMVRYIRLKSKPIALAWLANREHIAAGCTDGSVYIVDATEVTVLRSQKIVNGWIYSISSHPTDGSLVVAGSNGQIRRLIP